jgi:hypothetical protein
LTSLPGSSRDRRAGRRAVWLLLVFAAAVLARSGAVVALSANLGDDRDDYLTVARQYVEHGFWSGFRGIPDSFRPPLYPLTLAFLLRLGGGAAAIGVLHVLLGTATVVLTWIVGCRLGLRGWATFAALLVALDPLLIQYTTWPMTETAFTFLVILLVMVTTPPAGGSGAADGGLSPLRSLVAGAVFGACAVCRPTIWPTGPFIVAWSLWRARRDVRLRRAVVLRLALACAAAAIVVSPWALRNQRLLGVPIVTTTHGGYTLLLGNNPAFYREVAARPIAAEWTSAEPDRFQAEWFRDLIARMESELGPGAGEVAQDRWMYAQARRAMVENPRLFARACLLRLLRFWSIVPLPPSRGALPQVAVWSISAGFAIELGLFLAGLIYLAAGWIRRGRAASAGGDGLAAPGGRDVNSGGWNDRWVLPLAIVASFTLAHMLYWSNMRMRAPLVPLIALVAAYGASRLLSGQRARSPR